MSLFRLDPQHTVLLVVDMQQRLMPSIHDAEQVLGQAGRLLDGFIVLGRSVLVTEQYPKGLGRTVSQIQQRLPGDVFSCEKLKFSACVGSVLNELRRLEARAILVAGVEAHVCVLQTCLDLLESGYPTAVVVDAIGSRRPTDRQVAIDRMTQMGVMPTTVESALLELVVEAGGEKFKAILPLIR